MVRRYQVHTMDHPTQQFYRPSRAFWRAVFVPHEQVMPTTASPTRFENPPG